MTNSIVSASTSNPVAAGGGTNQVHLFVQDLPLIRLDEQMAQSYRAELTKWPEAERAVLESKGGTNSIVMEDDDRRILIGHLLTLMNTKQWTPFAGGIYDCGDFLEIIVAGAVSNGGQYNTFFFKSRKGPMMFLQFIPMGRVPSGPR